MRWFWGGIVILSFALGVVACGNPPTPRITATTMGTAVASGKITNAMTTFKPTDHAIYIVVDTENVIGGTPMGVKWYAVEAGSAKNQLLLENEVQLDPLNTSGEFALTSTGDLTPGKYKVVVYLNGKEDRTVEFDVK